MNKIAKQVQELYRAEREEACYNIMDVEKYLIKIAEEGLIWILKGMKDISDVELVAIDYYLNLYRGNQIYDNLDISFPH
ncbi:hypothetical protein [Oceanobacillus oncorhynchi]|uniref:hypothetical protein n=1 Tax=Oceanobacillus oncorhynchi TaxID=545501 RepID=UPI0034D757CE